MADLIVADDEYAQFAQLTAAFAQSFEERLIDYIAILVSVRQTAVMSGVVAERLSEFNINTRDILKGATEGLASTIAQASSQFIQEIDAKDEYLY